LGRVLARWSADPGNAGLAEPPPRHADRNNSSDLPHKTAGCQRRSIDSREEYQRFQVAVKAAKLNVE
jgi:hypothetical protein